MNFQEVHCGAMSQIHTHPAPSVGAHIKEWRRRRRMSQLAFALEADISQKHLSFIESGRSAPSRDMVLRLAERLDVPLRERNALVLAAGYAPVYPERPLDDPALAAAKSAIELILKGHEPYPALAIDRYWTLVSANDAVYRLVSMIEDRALLKAPVNVMRLSLAPGGLAPHIANLGQWRGHLLERLRHGATLTGDPKLQALYGEMTALGPPPGLDGAEEEGMGFDIAIPLKLKTPRGLLSLISTTTIFGTPVDVTLSEIALETFFPADQASAEMLRALAG
jgi:transcriptional regulator with XRE-family HTH domain